MKKLLLFLSFLLFSLISFQQVTTVLVAPPYPNPQISEWENGNGDPWSLTVSNFTGVDIDVKITGTIELNGDLVAVIDVAKVPTKTLNPGVTTFTNPDLVPADAITLSSLNQADILLSGKLPAGLYTYCVELVHPLDQTSVIARSCVTFVITEQQLPILLTPINGQVIMPEMANSQIFTWTPMTPPAIAPQTLKYRFLMAEIMEGQTDVQALQGNTAVIDMELDGSTTTMQWPPTLVADTGNYVWTIQSYDPDNLDNLNNPTPYGPQSTHGYSAPHTLTIGDTSNNSSPDLLDELTGDTLYAGENGEFKIVLDSNVTASAGTFTGKGKVLIPMFRAWFEVKFNGIKIATNMRLQEGKVTVSKYGNAPTYPIDWIAQVGSSMPWTHNVVSGIDNFINTVTDPLPITLDSTLIEDMYDDASDNLLKVPQGINGADIGIADDLNMAFTHIIFRPNESEIGAVMSIDCPASWEVLDGTSEIGFKATEFLFHPKKFDFTRGKLEIVSDLHINPPGDKFKLIFRKPSPNNADTVRFGTFYSWNLDDTASFFSVDLDAEFNRSVMTPVPDNGNAKVTAEFSATSENWDDLILFGNLPLSEIVSTNGVRIEAANMFLDMSINRNVSTMTFPENFTFDPTMPEENWKGFCMESAYVRLPEGIKTHAEGPIGIGAENIIIDKTGFTFDLYAENVFSYPNVSLAEMTASIDTVRLSVLQNSITSGGLDGKVVLPISMADEINGIAYTAMWNNGIPNDFMGESEFKGFTFTVNPIDTIAASVWKARLFLMPTTSIGMSVGVGEGENGNKGDFGFYLNLDGKLTIKTRLGAVGDVKLPGLEFQGLGIDYKKYNGQENGTFNFNGGSWSFASPQKSIKGFPFTIGGISIHNKIAHDGEMYRGALNVIGDINFTDEIGGGIELANVFAVRNDNEASDDEYVEPNGNTGPVMTTPATRSRSNSSGMSYNPFNLTFPEDNLIKEINNFNPTPIAPDGIFDRLKAKYIKTAVDCVYVNVDVAAVKIIGYVKIRSEDPVYGDGFKGKLNATFNALSLEVEALAEFGNTTYQALTEDEAYDYWRVEAGVATTGLGFGIPPSSPVIYLKGGSLGAFKNMTSIAAGEGNTTAQCDELFAKPLPVVNSLTSGLNFRPKQGNWGFMAKIRCAATKEEAFNFDVGLKAEFAGKSMQNIVLRGDFFIGSSIQKRNKAWGKGFVEIDYNHPQRKFEINAQIELKKKPLEAFVPLNLLIDGIGPSEDQNEFMWRLCLGTFSNPATVKVDLTEDVEDNLSDATQGQTQATGGPQGSATMLNANFYLMTGKNIEVVNGFTEQFVDDYEAAMTDVDGSEGDEMSTLGSMESQVSNTGGSFESGDGFAFGVGVRLGRPDPVFRKVLGSNKVRFWYRFGAGGEFNLGLYDYSDYSCDGLDYDPIGMNGWRASGNFGFWAVAGAGFRVEKIKILWKEFCENGCNATLFDLGLGAWIFGEMPKPTFVAGGIDGRVNILGLFKVKFKAKFDFGVKCDLTPNDNGIDESFFEDLEFVVNSEYNRRGRIGLNKRADNIKFQFAGEIENEEYYITNSETGADELFEIAPAFVNLTHNFRHNNGSSNGMKTRFSGTKQNSGIVLSDNIDMWPCWRNLGKWRRVGVHKNSGVNLGSCSMGNDKTITTKKNQGNVLTINTDVKIMKRSPNGGSWSNLSFGGNIVKKPYSKNYSSGDLNN